MMNCSFDSAIELFKNDFQDFFLKVRDYKENEKNGYRWVVDEKYKIVSMHGFPANISLEKGQKNFQNTMRRRALRMKKIITNSDKILFISNRDDERNDFYKFMNNFKEIYDKKIIFLNIRHQEDATFNKYEKTISKDLKFIEYTFHDIHPDGNTSENPRYWLGNEKEWKKIMKNIKLSNIVDSNELKKEEAVIR